MIDDKIMRNKDKVINETIIDVESKCGKLSDKKKEELKSLLKDSIITENMGFEVVNYITDKSNKRIMLIPIMKYDSLNFKYEDSKDKKEV